MGSVTSDVCGSYVVVARLVPGNPLVARGAVREVVATWIEPGHLREAKSLCSEDLRLDLRPNRFGEMLWIAWRRAEIMLRHSSLAPGPDHRLSRCRADAALRDLALATIDERGGVGRWMIGALDRGASFEGRYPCEWGLWHRVHPGPACPLGS